MEGINLHPEMKFFYTQRDQDNNKLAQTLLHSGVYTVLFFFLPNAMPPFTHFVFGWPKDIIYNFPFPVVYVRVHLYEIKLFSLIGHPIYYEKVQRF